MARIPNDGTARPMLTTAVANAEPRRMWPSQIANGSTRSPAMITAATDTQMCSPSRVQIESGPDQVVGSERNSWTDSQVVIRPSAPTG